MGKFRVGLHKWGLTNKWSIFGLTFPYISLGANKFSHPKKENDYGDGFWWTPMGFFQVCFKFKKKLLLFLFWDI